MEENHEYSRLHSTMQADIIHPLSSLSWGKCCKLPSLEPSLQMFGMKATSDYSYKLPKAMSNVTFQSIQCATLGSKLYVLCPSSSYKTTLFVSCDGLDAWQTLCTPTCGCALTTYRSELLLIGGLEAHTNEVTNKVWWTNNEGADWHEKLHPMPTARRLTSAINTKSPECVIVAGGYVDTCEYELDIVEVLSDDLWYTVEPLPKPTQIYNLALHDQRVYLNAQHTLYCCDLKSLLASSPNSAKESPSLWRNLQVRESVPSLVSFGRHLVSICDRRISAYSVLTQSWIYVADSKWETGILGSLVLPNGDLVAVVSSQEYTSVYRASLEATPYNSDAQFSMSALSRLEGAGLKVLTALTENLSCFKSAIAVFLEESANKSCSRRECTELIIHQWQSGRGSYTPTWRNLLGNVLQSMNKNELSQQIKDYLSGTKQEYLEAYQQILATQECVQMWFFKIVLLGAPRLGKTTVRRRLSGEIEDIHSSGEFDREEPSTGTVDSRHGVVIRDLSSTTVLMTPSEWLATKDLTDETRAFFDYLYSHICKVKDPPQKHKFLTTNKSAPSVQVNSSTKSREPMAIGPSSDSIKFFESNSSNQPFAQQKIVQTQHLPEVVEMIRSIVSPKYWKEVAHMFKDTAFVKMEDTGGQPEFMDMLPALTIGPALYLLFCKLTDSLHSQYTVSYLSKSGRCSVPRESTYTVEEVIMTALSSISCLRSSIIPKRKDIAASSTAKELLISCNKAVAYVVGTHKDCVTENDVDKFDKDLQDCIRPTAFFKDRIVQFFSKTQRMILPIDNMHGGSSEIQMVRKILEEGLKKHFKKLSIPASWLVLSLCLRKREERTASLDSVLQLAGELGIDQSEAMVALWFLHHYAGVLMYFPDLPEMKDTVICDSQVVYDSATTLIIKTFESSAGEAASEQFRKTGQFSLEEIREATAHVSGDYIPLEKLVKLLEHLNILASFIQPVPSPTCLCPCSKKVYFMPSVLRNASHDEIAEWWKTISPMSSPAPLFIRYKCGYSPIGVFPAMIANLSGNQLLEMVVDRLRKNFVTFYFGNDYDMVTLISQPKYYAVHIARLPSAKTLTHEVCRKVRSLVETSLRTVTSQMNYSFTVEYQLAFECPSHPGRDHLCVVKKGDASPHMMHCLKNEDSITPLEMQHQHLVWFKNCHSYSKNGSSVNSISLASLNCLKWRNKTGEVCVFHLVDEVSSKWNNFGLALGITQNQLDSWEMQYHENAVKCWNQVMECWLRRGGTLQYPASWEGLYSLLEDFNFRKVARELEEAVSNQDL